MIPNREGARIVEFEGEGARSSHALRTPLRGTLPDGGDDATLGQYIGVLREYRWLIAALTAVAVALAGTYLVLAAPTYRSDALLQVEDKTKGIAGLDDMASMFSEKSLADTEIEIIRSRSLIGTVVDDLNLTIDAHPKTFPIIGGAVFRRHQGPDLRASLLGFTRYAWGGERIKVPRLQVPESLLDEPLKLVAGEGGAFKLLGPDGNLLVAGQVGQPAAVGASEDRVEIFVAELHARPETHFRVMKRRRAGVIDDLQEALRIAEKGKKTGILTMSLDGTDPRQVSAILDALGQTYVRQNVERKSAEAEKSLQFLQEQLPILKKNVDATESALKTYQLKKGTVDLTIETQSMLDRAVDIEKSLSELQMTHSELRQRFSENHPMLTSLKEKELQLKGEKTAIESKMRGLPEQELEILRLNRDAKVASELYFLLLNKSQELSVVKSGTVGNVRILDTALKPYEPVSPKKGPVLALALLLGLGAGIGAAFARKALDQGVEDPEEIEALTGLSVYASVPHSEREAQIERDHEKGSTGPVLLAAVDPAELAIESLRSLRTALQFALVDARNNVVSVGGPSPGVGKSFVTANLAHVLATMGKRVAVVDCDLRRGRLHRYLGGHRSRGVSEIVSGDLPLADGLRKTVHENLDFVSTGKLPPNPSEVIASSRFRAFLNDLSARYDLVLLDTPPILAVTDAAIVGALSGVNLLALRAGKHPAREISVAVKHFIDAGVKLHGVVLNDVRMGGGRYSYAYHYQYEYRSDAKDD